MFDIGFGELLLIGILALIVLGPERLPEVARTAGRWVRQIRDFVANVQQDLGHELQGGGLEELRKLRADLDEARALIQRSSSNLMQGLSQPVTPTADDQDHWPTTAALGAPEPAAPEAGKRPVRAKKKKQPHRAAAVKAGNKKKSGRKPIRSSSRTPHGGQRKPGKR